MAPFLSNGLLMRIIGRKKKNIILGFEIGFGVVVLFSVVQCCVVLSEADEVSLSRVSGVRSSFIPSPS